MRGTPAGTLPGALVGERSLLLIPRFLNSRGAVLGRHLAGGDRDRNVVHDASDVRPEILVEEDLVVGRGGEVVAPSACSADW